MMLISWSWPWSKLVSLLLPERFLSGPWWFEQDRSLPLGEIPPYKIMTRRRMLKSLLCVQRLG